MRDASGSHAASSNDGGKPPIVVSQEDRLAGTAPTSVWPNQSGANRKAELSGGSEMPIITTSPQHILRHNISDEQLEKLSSSQTSSLENLMWACFGAASGDLSATLRNINSAFIADEKKPLDWVSTVEIVFFFVAVAVFLVLRTICAGYNKDRGKLVREIRGEQT